ncbi:HAMP domain-containing protein [Thermosulfurimonas marina]|uniref:HAMP domain-containing protein n=1 Tax=Thermosulfurimonas marina TaxID=2047767 RepID=A0A6H1WRN3_9BACT|nr:methyl-accepting chemotaxis protein [Thermosulfurimonas marina]QJA05814.1 HAMP domain-containing protein [Thermosulfurimonas marina]
MGRRAMGFVERVDRSLKMWQKLAVVAFCVVVLVVVNTAVLLVMQKRTERLQREAHRATQAMDTLDALLAEHLRWKVNLLTGLLNESPPEILVDPDRCPLQKFLASWRAEAPEEKELVARIREVDRKLHLAGGEISKLLSEEADFEEVVAVYNERANPLSKELLFKLLPRLEDLLGKRMDQLQGEARRSLDLVKKVSLFLNLWLVVGTLLVFAFMAYRLGRKVRQVLSAVDRMAGGDFSFRTRASGRDEMAQILAHLDRMADHLQPLIRDTAEVSRKGETLSEEVRERLEAAAREAEAAGERATRMKEEAGAILQSVEEESRSINEISTAIQEISQNTTRASMITKEAVEKAQRAQEIMHRVGAASQEIEGVIQLITGIAEQTKFLALNATIEAARAGEAGKGFAVVAGEVKELARQTAEATGEITEKIRTMQAESEEALRAADEIAGVIQEIDQIASAIAAAAEEQTAVIADIAQKVEKQKAGAGQFAREAEEAYTAAQKTLSGVKENLQAMHQLVEVVKELARSVSRFKV